MQVLEYRPGSNHVEGAVELARPSGNGTRCISSSCGFPALSNGSIPTTSQPSRASQPKSHRARCQYRGVVPAGGVRIGPDGDSAPRLSREPRSSAWGSTGRSLRPSVVDSSNRGDRIGTGRHSNRSRRSESGSPSSGREAAPRHCRKGRIQRFPASSLVPSFASFGRTVIAQLYRPRVRRTLLRHKGA